MKNPAEYIRSRIRLNAQYKKVFGTEEGQAVLRHLMTASGMTLPSPGTDTSRSTYMNGKRDLVLSILQFVNKDEAAIIAELEKIVKEQGEANGG